MQSPVELHALPRSCNNVDANTLFLSREDKSFQTLMIPLEGGLLSEKEPSEKGGE
jgi:hypothetical protein